MAQESREQTIHSKFFDDYRSSVTAHDLMVAEQTDKVKEILGEFHLTTEVDKQRYALQHDDMMKPFPEITFDFGVSQKQSAPEDEYDCTPLFDNLGNSTLESNMPFVEQRHEDTQQASFSASSHEVESNERESHQFNLSHSNSQQDFFGKYFADENSPVQVTSSLIG